MTASEVHVSIAVEGFGYLLDELRTLPDRFQKKILRQALGESAERIKSAIYTAMSGEIIMPRSGRLQAGMISGNVRALPHRSGVVGVGVRLPTREQLGIPADATHYYPAALEYGTPTMPPKAPIRRTVNRIRQSEQQRIIDAIRDGIERLLGRVARRRRMGMGERLELGKEAT